MSWIFPFGAPVTVTTDQGRQFESELMHSLQEYFEICRIPTTSYHPEANGLIENFHCILRTALTAQFDAGHWSQHLPMILLAFRRSINCDTNFNKPAIAAYFRKVLTLRPHPLPNALI